MTRFRNEIGRGLHRNYPRPHPTGRPVRSASSRGWRWGSFPLLLLVWLTLGMPRAKALDPRRSLAQYQRQAWGPEQGLPCNNVISVTQGSDGYLWLGTEEGLVRFDGVRTRVCDHHTDPALVGNSVYSVIEDARHPGELLLGSAGGVCRYAGGKVSVFRSNPELAGFSAATLFQDPLDGALWVRSPHGILRVGPDGVMTEAAGTVPGWPPGKVRTVCRDATGHLWVGTAEGLYRQHDAAPAAAGRGFDLVPGWAGKGVDHLTPARGGGIWVGSRDGGTGRLSEDGVFHPRPALAGCLVTRMFEDRSGVLWVGTNGSGLFRLPVREEGGAGPPAAAFTTDHGLIHNLVNGLCEDREGNFWIATQLGLQVLRGVRFVNYGRPEGLAGDDVRTVFEDRRGQIWIGNENGLGRLDPAGDRVTSFPLPTSPLRPGNSRVLCVGEGEDNDTVWAGTHAGIVAWRDGRLEPCPLRADLDRSAVRAMCRDAAGDRWIATSDGLYQVRGRQVQARLTAAEGLASDSVRALHADGHGSLWIATSAGLSQRAADGRLTNFLNFGPGRGDGTVLSFLDDPNPTGDLFVGTEFGLHRVHTAADGRVESGATPNGRGSSTTSSGDWSRTTGATCG